MADTTADIRAYLERPLDELLEELALYQEAVAGPERGPADAWQRLVPALRQRICVEWNWCVRRQDARFDDPVNLTALIIPLIVPAVQAWGVPVALVAVILVKRGLDAFCDCPPIGAR